jgi:TonB family protein
VIEWISRMKIVMSSEVACRAGARRRRETSLNETPEAERDFSTTLRFARNDKKVVAPLEFAAFSSPPPNINFPNKLMTSFLVRIIFVLLVLFCVVPASQAKGMIYDARDPAQNRELRRHMVNMEGPIYPKSARMMRKVGDGVFWMKFDKTGRVKAVKIMKSTTHPDLDNSAVYACYRWRCRPGEVDQAIVPLVFHFGGSGSRVTREVP